MRDHGDQGSCGAFDPFRLGALQELASSRRVRFHFGELLSSAQNATPPAACGRDWFAVPVRRRRRFGGSRSGIDQQRMGRCDIRVGERQHRAGCASRKHLYPYEHRSACSIGQCIRSTCTSCGMVCAHVRWPDPSGRVFATGDAGARCRRTLRDGICRAGSSADRTG